MSSRRLQWPASYALSLAVLCFVQVLKESACVCPSPYYPPTHTACQDPSPNSVDPKGISPADKEIIVNEHNRIRAAEQATDMLKMTWDDELAFVAQKLAEECIFQHDPERDIICKYPVGQNIALGYADWRSAIQGWASERSDFQYGVSGTGTGHYTQIVWNATQKVGCGFSHCSNLEGGFYVCNYAPAGNYADRLLYPYTEGDSCSACPDHCSDGLCDCGGLICKNDFTLDLASCTCLCSSPFQGSADCNLDCSNATDDPVCGQPSGYSASDCSYSNVPPVCPIMCGVCPGSMCSALQSVSIADLSNSETTLSEQATTTAAQPTEFLSERPAVAETSRGFSSTTATTVTTARTTRQITAAKTTARPIQTTVKPKTTRTTTRKKPTTKTTRKPTTKTTRRPPTTRRGH